MIDLYLRERFAKREQAQVKDLANAVPVGRSQLTDMFRKHLGVSPGEVMRRAQIEEAKRLLTRSDFSLDEIALRTGFMKARNLSRVFRRVVGASPSAFRKRT